MDDAFKLSQIIPVDDLRLSNQVPSDRHKLRRLLQEVREKEDALETLVHEAMTRRAEYASYAESILDVLAPGRIIPADVWSIVFGFIPDSRWQLSWVCRGWREIALATPALWSDIPDLGLPVQSPANFLSKLRLHVKCSKGRPLKISKLHLPLKTKFCPDDLEEFFTIFHAMIPRIQHICLELGTISANIFSFLVVAPQHFPQLQVVEISTAANARTQGNLSALPEMKIFQSSPKLSSVRCFLTPAGAIPPMTTFLRIPWATVTALNLAWLTRQDVYHVLEHAPSLKTFRIWSGAKYLEDSQGPVTQKRIQHSQLQVFSWVSSAALNLDLFPLLDFPKIQEIFIHTYKAFWNRAVQTSTTSITPLIRQPFPHLTWLFIGPQWQNSYKGQRLVTLLQLTPGLISLWLSWVDGMEAVFDALSMPEAEGQWLLPSLRHLRIANVPTETLMSTESVGWHCALRKFGKQRGLVGQSSNDSDSSVQIVLSGTEKYKTREMKKVRSGILRCLNGSPVAPSPEVEDAPEEPLEAICKLIDQINAPCRGEDEVMYISAKLAQKAKLRAVVNDLASDEAKCQRSVERLLPTLVDVKELPAEFSDLSKFLRSEGDDSLIARLVEKWDACRSRYLNSPGWVLHTNHQVSPSDGAVCFIRYVHRLESPKTLKEFFAAFSWCGKLDDSGAYA